MRRTERIAAVATVVLGAVVATACSVDVRGDIDLDLLERERAAGDELPAGVVGGDDALSVDGGTSRLITSVDDMSYWAALTTDNKVCVVLERGGSDDWGASCTFAHDFNRGGVGIGTGGSQTLFVPDDFPSPMTDGWEQIAPNLYRSA
ncbi:hypothetical protein [Georgenia sp. SYP-B2076]|uniref:hypothetical protein n=1 Tax=Georgenia sp. SYP-B2076 TaxID=2495881 RepID=UPI000F8CA1FC|nr:hypothetical protein [Georgenia sp. SYP-B2076]